MSSRHRHFDGSANSADTAIGEVEDLTSSIKPALFKVGDRPSFPPWRPAVGMQVDVARIAIQNLLHLLRVVSPVGGNPQRSARLHPRCRQYRELGSQQPALGVGG